MTNRQQEIKRKGFNISSGIRTDEAYSTPVYGVPVDYNKIKIGTKSLEDAILNLGSLKKVNSSLSNKSSILEALGNSDLDTLRSASEFFFNSNGIYSRLCKYLAYLYKYDWYVTPFIYDDANKVNVDKMTKEFYKILDYLDTSNVKRLLGEIALKVIKDGCYYGYRLESPDMLRIQELPIKYCRTRFFQGTKPIIEFNMKYFEDEFRDEEYRLRILKLFPTDFQKGYSMYKGNKLKADFQGDQAGWYLLDPAFAIKFSASPNDFPVIAGAIPSLIELDEAQDLDRRKTMQKLLKIIIQKLPLDKNNELVFDKDEAVDIHNNSVTMLKRAVGVDVLTTFADIDVADMSDKNSATTTDDLKKVERSVFNQTGISQNIFNTDGNLALEKSIRNDEASMRGLLLQFQDFLNDSISSFNRNKKRFNFKVYILETTIYNYVDLATKFKEQVQLGYSKILPQIALGNSQSSVLANATFENKILNLAEIMIPPSMSSTMSGSNNLPSPSSQVKNNEPKKTGRPEQADENKSEKTIANKESME